MTEPIGANSGADGLGGDGEPGGAVLFEGGDVVGAAEGQADVVQALHEAPAGVVVDLERLHQVLGEAAADDAHLAASRSTVTWAGGTASAASWISATTFSGKTTGSSPALVELVRKMSPNLGAMTARKP